MIRLESTHFLRRAALVAVSLLSVSGLGLAQHGVPDAEQPGQHDCGPTAAAAIMKWFQENGFPEIETRGDEPSNEIDDLRDQLHEDAGTDDEGTWSNKLAIAINKMLEGGPYEGALRAGLGTSSTMKSFSALDQWFADECMVLLLLCLDGQEDHYVAVNNLTGSGATRSLEYMDPATGSKHTTTLTDSGDKLTLTRNGTTGYICGIIVVCPKNSTKSSTEVIPDVGTKITYEPIFPPTNKAKDLHIRVRDGNQANYQVTGLPAGWQWEVHTIDGKHYISFYKGTSTNDLESGQDIVVTYTGPLTVRRRSRVVNQTTTGVLSPTTGALPSEHGYTVSNDQPDPTRPENLVCSITTVVPGYVSAHLAWDASTDPTVDAYEIYDADTNELLAQTPIAEFDLLVEADTFQRVIVAARNADGELSDDSDPVAVHLDDAGAIELLPAPPQPVPYDSPLRPNVNGFDMLLDMPQVFSPGPLFVTTYVGGLAPQMPPGAAPFFAAWHLSSQAQIEPGPIGVAIRYDETWIPGGESSLHLLALVNGNWQDVTQGVDPAQNVLFGTIPQLTSLAIVGPERIGTSYCGPAVENSTGAPAILEAAGSPFVVDNLLTLTARNLPPHQFGYLLTSQSEGFIANPGGSQGNLCLGGTIARFVGNVQNSGAAGWFQFDVDLTQIPMSPPVAVMPGQTWHYQGWFRDAIPQATSNFTDGIQIVWQ
ncbi:MAG: hypothetical protein GY711_00755 [bacterium]|nr:hypothetical protein [bacterium]